MPPAARAPWHGGPINKKLLQGWCQVIYFQSMDSKKMTGYQNEVKGIAK
jgi:hypothetical protein